MNCPACHQDKPREEFRSYQRWSGRTFPTTLCYDCRQANRRQRRERIARFRNGRQVVDDPAYTNCLRRRLEQVTFSWGKCASGRAGQLLDGHCLTCQQRQLATPTAGRRQAGHCASAPARAIVNAAGEQE
jgi:hypothetical protein